MISQSWFDMDIPLFVSRRRLRKRRTFPKPVTSWALDSGGFTELNLFGEWRTTAAEYVADVRRFADEMVLLDWVAPQDWMCEPSVLAKTRKTISEHQHLTVASVEVLREELGMLVIPVLQGWAVDDYLHHIELYARHGFELEREPLVGIGSVCRRQNMTEAGAIIRRLASEGIRLHGFGIKKTGLESYGDALASADSMAWSYRARRDHPLPGCTHKSCSNCPRFAVRWYQQVLARLGQLRLEV